MAEGVSFEKKSGFSSLQVARVELSRLRDVGKIQMKVEQTSLKFRK